MSTDPKTTPIIQQRKPKFNFQSAFTFSLRCLHVFVPLDGYTINNAVSVENGMVMRTKSGEPGEHPDYLSFLIRLWRVLGDGESQDPKEVAWRASLESAQTGATLNFADLEDLFDFLREQTGHAQDTSEDEDAHTTTVVLVIHRIERRRKGS
jgi:hypothetical protein